jgi:zinc transport system substrate-binding protein
LKLSLVALTALIAACGRPDRTQPVTPGRRPTVYVVNYPLQYFAERIGGGAVDVVFPAPAGDDPAFWVPDPATVEAFQGADLILLNGAGYAKWTEPVSLPLAKLVNTSAGFRDQYIALDDAVTHAHGPGGAHEHGATAFTTWLDPQLAIEQARATRDAFAGRWPALEAEFSAGFEALRGDLESLDVALGRIVSADAEQPLVVSHPVYQYLARRYGLDVVSVHWEPDEMPDEASWRELEGILARHPARFMIWEGPPLDEAARRLEAIGVGSVVFSPCGNTPPGGDYLSTMRANLTNLRAIGSER